MNRTHRPLPRFSISLVLAIVAILLPMPAVAERGVIDPVIDPIAPPAPGEPIDAHAELIAVIDDYQAFVAQYYPAGPEAAALAPLTDMVLSLPRDEAYAAFLLPTVKQARYTLELLHLAMAERMGSPPPAAPAEEFPKADYPRIDPLFPVEMGLDFITEDLPELLTIFDFILGCNILVPRSCIPQTPNIDAGRLLGWCIPDADGDGVPVRLSDPIVLGIKLGLSGLETLKLVEHDACGQDFTAVGFGANLSLLCIVTDLIEAVAIGLLENQLWCEELIDDAETSASYLRLAYIHEQLGSHNATIAGQLGGLSTQMADVHNRIDIAMEKRRIHLEVVRSGSSWPKFIVIATEAGLPVDVDFISVESSRSIPLDFDDCRGHVSISRLQQGIYSFAATRSTNAQFFKLAAQRADGAEYYGFIVFRRDE